MIIKVPIYVDLDAIDPDLLPVVVEAMSKRFYLTLRKESLFKNLKIDSESSLTLDTVTNAKIISREKALESLRTKK
jgi:hypothetical protein